MYVDFDLKHYTRLAEPLFFHAQACSGSRKVKETDPISGVVTSTNVPCELCKRGIERFAEIPAQFLTDVLSEPEAQKASFQMATLIVESTLNSFNNRSKRGQRNKAAGMDLLRTYQENGGKLRS